MKVALVHDYLHQFGGAERVLKAFTELYPRAPIFTLFYDAERTKGVFADRQIVTSRLQRRRFIRERHHLFPWLMPFHVEQFDLRDFDLVLSDSSSFAKGVITKPGTIHIDYCHTPMRYAWDDSHQYLEGYGLPWFAKRFAPWGLNYLRMWDYEASRRVDHFIANSILVKQRIQKYYRRESTVIYPPVEFPGTVELSSSIDGTERAAELTPKDAKADYFLVVARLEPYKQTELAIETCNELRLPLRIVGIGREFTRLKRLAGRTVSFLGSVSDDELHSLYTNARAVIFPQLEDFGIVPLEAMAHCTPVIAYGAGGALESVVRDTTGIFFRKQTTQSLIEAIKRFETMRFDKDVIRARAATFDKATFQDRIQSYIADVLSHQLTQRYGT
ncbi:MAG: hypothetical protein A2666_05660 [Parcubacteria group bacterium RIFCSPHIGHO2_01_FULL_47_10b]|nr:MAG: hypothetical protein A2666_05660 [Parcubacteria group bacterium RIFCSPHIGHO2_01_FULL_47_10b]QBM02303.1 D-inositol-3-phosphate glycosyltransferase [uncultured archaeon]